MIPPRQRRILSPEMLLQRLEEIDVFAAHERHHHPQRAHEPRPDQHVPASGHELRLLDTGRDILRKEMAHQRQPVGRALQILPLVDEMCAGAIFVGLLARFLGAAQQPQVTEFVAAGDGLVVDHCGARGPAGDDVVGERDEFVFLVLVHDKDHAFLDVADDDAGALRLETDDEIGYRGGLAFAQQLFEAEIVDAEFRADACEEAALE